MNRFDQIHAHWRCMGRTLQKGPRYWPRVGFYLRGLVRAFAGQRPHRPLHAGK